MKTACASTGSPNDIIPNETYLNLRMAQYNSKVKDNIVDQICNILTI